MLSTAARCGRTDKCMAGGKQQAHISAAHVSHGLYVSTMLSSRGVPGGCAGKAGRWWWIWRVHRGTQARWAGGYGPEGYLGMCGRGGQVVVDLGGVRHGVQLLPNCRQRARDQVGRSLPPQPEHHGGAHVKGVALPVEVPRAAARDDVPAHTPVGEPARMLQPTLASPSAVTELPDYELHSQPSVHVVWGKWARALKGLQGCSNPTPLFCK